MRANAEPTPIGQRSRTVSWSRDVQRVATPLAVAAAVCFAWTSSANAQWQPTEPITFIVMAGKGGGADKAVRFMAKTIAEQQLANVPINPVNITGASGANAMVELKKRTGDNHAIMFTLNSFYTTPLRRPELGIDISTFTPIARMAEDTFVLWVHRDHAGIRSMGDFVKAAGGAGRDWVMAGTGTGSEDNLLTDFLNSTYGLRMTYRPFKGGGKVAKQLVEKKVDSTVNNPSEQNKYFAQGITKPIAAFTPKRLPAYIRTPTLRETGMDFHYYMQRSVVGAPGMSPAAVGYYQQLFKRVFDSPEWQSYRQKNSLHGAFLTGQALRSYWLKEREKHARWQMAIDILKPN